MQGRFWYKLILIWTLLMGWLRALSITIPTICTLPQLPLQAGRFFLQAVREIVMDAMRNNLYSQFDFIKKRPEIR